MAIKDSILNVVIRAKDLAQGTLARFRRGLKDTDEQAEKTSNSLGNLARRAGQVVGAFVGFESVRRGIIGVLRTGDQFEQLNIQLEALTGSAEAGQEAFEWIREFTRNTPLQLEDTTAAFVRLKAFGIDPTNGTLQSLVDANARVGGSSEQLERIILQLGQAWAAGRLQGENFKTLLESGIPVLDILSDVTGKTAAEVLEMSTNGELTRDVMQQLFDELGRQADGAAARSMSTLTGITSNLKDAWQGFLFTVAQSGALDSAKVQLQELLNAANRLADDGTLERWANAVSDAIVGLFNGIRTGIDTIIRFRGEIALLAKAFVAIKIAQATTQLIGWSRAAVRAAANTGILGGAINGSIRSFGRVQSAMAALSSFALGWEFGSYLRNQFVFVEKASNTLVAGLLKGWATLELGWEATKAIFNDDTVEQATARYRQRIDEISESNRILNEEAQKAADSLANVGKQGQEAVQEIRTIVDLTTDAITTTSKTAGKAVDEALERLDQDITKIKTGIGELGTQAIADFNLIRQAIEESGESGEQEAARLSAAFLGAFEKIETEAGREQLLAGLRQAVASGIISLAQFEELLEEVGLAALGAEKDLDSLGDAAERAAGKTRDLGRASQEAAEAAEAGAQRGGGAFAILTGAIAGYTQQVAALSDRARAEFVDLATGIQGAGEVAGGLEVRLAEVTQRIRDIRFQGLRTFDATGLQGALQKLGTSAATVEKRFLEQQIALRDLGDQYEAGAISAQRFVREGELALQNADLLDDASLDRFRGQIAAARVEMERLRDTTADTLGNLQDELDRLRGNTVAIEERRNQQRIQDLENQLGRNRALGDDQSIRDAEESLRIAREISQVQRERANEARREQQQANAEAARGARQEESQRARNGASGSNAVNSGSTQTINLRLEGGQTASIQTDNPDALLDLLSAAGFTTA